MSDHSNKSSSSEGASAEEDGVEGMPTLVHDINLADLAFENTHFARGAFGRVVKADYFGVTVCVKLIKKQKKKEFAKFAIREMAALKYVGYTTFFCVLKYFPTFSIHKLNNKKYK